MKRCRANSATLLVFGRRALSGARAGTGTQQATCQRDQPDALPAELLPLKRGRWS